MKEDKDTVDEYEDKYYRRKVVGAKFISNVAYHLVLETYFDKDYLKVLIEEGDTVIWSRDMNNISYSFSKSINLRRKILINLAEEFFEELNKDNIADINSIGIIDN